VAVVSWKVWPGHSPGWTEENHENPVRMVGNRVRLKPEQSSRVSYNCYGLYFQIYFTIEG
jgi:hypothetical protein